MTRLDVPNDSGFGLSNLPYGVYRTVDGTPRIATRYGDHVVDLGVLLGEEGDDVVFAAPTLNAFMSQGPGRWRQVRDRISSALTDDVPPAALHHVDDVALLLPVDISDFADFNASAHHAGNLGRLFRLGITELLPQNWKHLPVSYHGRTSSIVVSGTDIVRPQGQRKAPGDSAPVFGPTQKLDIEAELGFIVGVGNPFGTSIAAADAERHIFGVVLFNDWSARDIQAWEMTPLGPNVGKSFASSVSPWVVPLLALDGARTTIRDQDVPVLPYLRMDAPWGLDIELTVRWNGDVVGRLPYSAMYWSPAQMLAHLTVTGAPTRTGDLFASGAVSGPLRDQRGAFIELTWDGAEPVTVGGAKRCYVADGDEIIISATARGLDYPIGFGECRSRVVAGGGLA